MQRTGQEVKMPEKIGIRELKNQTSRVLRAVHEEMAEYIVTLHGKPIAVLRPLNEDEIERLHQEGVEEKLAEMHILSEQVAVAWNSTLSGVETISEGRR
jgi:prevent-host-death family protein